MLLSTVSPQFTLMILSIIIKFKKVEILSLKNSEQMNFWTKKKKKEGNNIKILSTFKACSVKITNKRTMRKWFNWDLTFLERDQAMNWL